MRQISQVLMLSTLLFFTTACGKYLYRPKPPGTETESTGKAEKVPESNKEIARQNSKNIDRITKLSARVNRLHDKILSKREAGYNTIQAEELVGTINKEIATAKNLNFEDKFKELGAKLREIEKLLDQAEKLIKNAPKFGNQPIKKEKIDNKYGLDDREWVRELRGEPSPLNKHTGGHVKTGVTIMDATPLLRQCPCFKQMFNSFEMDHPPEVETWYFPEDRVIYVFMEVNSEIESLISRNELDPNLRDQILYRFCQTQVYAGWRLIYVGDPITDTESIFTQVFTGKMRFADMFGVGAIGRIAKATAVLPDLSLASLAFDKDFQLLNKLQAKQFQDFYDFLRILDPQTIEKLDNIKEIRESSKTEAEKNSKIQELVKKLSETIRKRIDAVSKIAGWSRTLNPSEGELRELIKLFPNKSDELNKNCRPFMGTISKLQKEFGKLRDDLLKFRTQFPELVFSDTDRISVFMLFEGVRFQEKELFGGGKVELPDISVKVLIKIKKDKYEEAIFDRESEEIKIKNVNQYIGEIKEYRRLASFGIAFPFALPPGRYEITFTITDNLRVKTITKEVKWIVISSESKEQDEF